MTEANLLHYCHLLFCYLILLLNFDLYSYSLFFRSFVVAVSSSLNLNLKLIGTLLQTLLNCDLTGLCINLEILLELRLVYTLKFIANLTLSLFLKLIALVTLSV